ncbi:MAG: peptidylprolyl isomerase [Chthoniobacteraceae bacterium]
MRPLRRVGGSLFAGLLALGVTTQKVGAAGETPLARVGGVELKAEELRASLANLDPNTRSALARDPALLNQVVRAMLIQRLVLQEALAKQWDQRPEVVAQLEQVRQNTIVESYLDSVSVPPQDFPSEAELRKAYEANKPALLVPRQYRLAQIFLELPSTADKAAIDKTRTRADAVRNSLRSRDADFAAIARAETDEKGGAARGGEIGWLTEAQIQPEIRPSIIGLAKGAVSEPIRLGDGWHILKTLDIKEAYTPTFDAVRAQLSQQLRAQRSKADRQTYVAGLLKENPVAINELALTEVVPAANAPAPVATPQPAAPKAPRPSFK